MIYCLFSSEYSYCANRLLQKSLDTFFFIEINTNFYLTLTKLYWFSTIKMQDLLLPPTFKEKENYKGLFL